MELLFALLEVCGELLLQLFAELLFEAGLRSLREPFRPAPNAYIATVAYVLFGALAGALSLWAVPTLFIASSARRIVNVVVTPVVAGATMAALGAWRRRRDQHVVLIDRFAYGYLFALVMALVRLRFGQ